MWAAIIILVFGTALAVRPMQGDGWFWEIGNSIGFLALVLLLILVGNGRGGLGRSSTHRWLGIVTFVVILTHCIWFLIGDPTTWEYLKWGAPHYMIAGLLSVGLLTLITITSLVSLRNRSYQNYKLFQTWHRRLSVIAAAFALVHILLSGYYLEQTWQLITLTLVALLVYAIPVNVNVNVAFVRHKVILLGLISSVVFISLRTMGHL